MDVTAHSLVTKAPFRLNELAPPSGGPWGSTYVDAAFCDVLRDMMGAASYERLTKRMAFLELMVRCSCVRVNTGVGSKRGKQPTLTRLRCYIAC